MTTTAGRSRSTFPSASGPEPAVPSTVFCIPVMGIFGSPVGDLMAATHLLVGYAALGVVLALRPRLLHRD